MKCLLYDALLLLFFKKDMFFSPIVLLTVLVLREGAEFFTVLSLPSCHPSHSVRSLAGPVEISATAGF